MKQNLTLENFWNDLYIKYPKATKVFCNWIDKYKVKNNWENLFNGGVCISGSEDDAFDFSTEAPKYHDLPWAMQLGIWIEFITDYYPEVDINYRMYKDFDLKGQITEDIKIMDDFLNEQSN